VLTRSSLPGNSQDQQARYIEAAVNGVLITSIYLPNGNPQPVPKFDYKLALFERLDSARSLICNVGHESVKGRQMKHAYVSSASAPRTWPKLFANGLNACFGAPISSRRRLAASGDNSPFRQLIGVIAQKRISSQWYELTT
jgi:hypothetical protein